jgi:UDP-N-acetyl-D-mannosaminuronic acid dehydrogenase
LASKKLRVSSQVEQADVFIIAVPTPFNPDKTADMRAVRSATEAVCRQHLRPGNLVVLESTSPPMTTQNLVQPILESSGLKPGGIFTWFIHLSGSCPERS